MISKSGFFTSTR